MKKFSSSIFIGNNFIFSICITSLWIWLDIHWYHVFPFFSSIIASKFGLKLHWLIPKYFLLKSESCKIANQISHVDSTMCGMAVIITLSLLQLFRYRACWKHKCTTPSPRAAQKIKDHYTTVIAPSFFGLGPSKKCTTLRWDVTIWWTRSHLLTEATKVLSGVRDWMISRNLNPET